MTNRLSHSSMSKFQDCAEAFRLHYREHLRSITQSAALLYGTAIDNATGALLEGKTLDEAKALFELSWLEQKVNGKLLQLAECPLIVYANSDLDTELLVKDDLDKLKLHRKSEDPLAEIDKVLANKEYMGFDGLPEDEKKYLNLANWLCLRRKGFLMLDAFQTKVMSKITEVLGVQVKVELKNEDGDSIIGYADLVARVRGYDHPVVLDVKTSTKEYDKDSVLVSPQLTLYVHDLSEKYEGTRLAGFLVMRKIILKNKTKKCLTCGHDGTGGKHKRCDAERDGKRCNGEWDVKINPEVQVQIIIDQIPQRTEDIVLENADYINTAIKNGVFHRSFGSCVRPYGKCTYYNLCYFGKKDGLVTIDPKKDRR